MDKTYIQGLIAENEIGLALSYMATQGRDTSLLLSNYNLHHCNFLKGILDYHDYVREVALVKNAILDLTQQAWIDTRNVSCVNPIIVIAANDDSAFSYAVLAALKSEGHHATVTNAVETPLMDSVIKNYRLVYVLTKNYFEEKTKWPISQTQKFTQTIGLAFDNCLDNKIYMGLVGNMNAKLHEVHEDMRKTLSLGGGVGGMAVQTLNLEEAKTKLDRDYTYLWGISIINCIEDNFSDGMKDMLKKLTK